MFAKHHATSSCHPGVTRSNKEQSLSKGTQPCIPKIHKLYFLHDKTKMQDKSHKLMKKAKRCTCTNRRMNRPKQQHASPNHLMLGA